MQHFPGILPPSLPPLSLARSRSLALSLSLTLFRNKAQVFDCSKKLFNLFGCELLRGFGVYVTLATSRA